MLATVGEEIGEHDFLIANDAGFDIALKKDRRVHWEVLPSDSPPAAELVGMSLLVPR